MADKKSIIRKTSIPISAFFFLVSIARAQIVQVPEPSNNWSWLPAPKDMIQSIFYLVSTVAVIIGLRSWRAQLKGRSKYEAAKNIIVGAYRVRDAIDNARSCYMMAEEYSERERKPDELRLEKEARDSLYAYAKRYEIVARALSEWYPAIVEAEALFGERGRKTIEALTYSAQRLKAAIQIYHWDKIDMAAGDFKLEENTPIRQSHLQNSNIIYGVYPRKEKGEEHNFARDDDGFQAGLESAVAGIKEFFEPYIK